MDVMTAPPAARYEDDARAAGLRASAEVTLDAIDKRRSEIWAVAFLTMIGLAVGMVLLSVHNDRGGWIVRLPAFRLGLVMTTIAVAAYVIEKEHHLRQLTMLLLEKHERVVHLEELDEMKSDFVAAVSHELRTPLTVILGCARTMKRRALTPEMTADFAEMIDRRGTALMSLIEEILDVQGIGSVGSRCPEPVDVSALLAEVAACAASRDVRIAVGTDLPVVVMVHRASLRRALTALVDNAIVHGGGNVYLDAHIETDVEDAWALVSVSDQGPGIASGDHERIFQPFERGMDVFTPGIGLGLAVVRSLVSSQHGQVWAETRFGGGAAFRVRLPVPD